MNVPSLRVAVDEIPDAGATIRGAFPPEWLGDTLLAPYEATSAVAVAIDARRVQDNVYVEGTLELTLSFHCSRTAAPGTKDFSVRVSELFQPADRNSVKLGAGLAGDHMDSAEPYTIDSRHIDLEPLIREALIMAQDPYPVLEDTDGDGGIRWQSAPGDVDPRWAKLKQVKIH